MVNGDAWAIPKYGKNTANNPYCLKIQQIEANRVCNPGSIDIYGIVNPTMVTQINEKNGNRIINGIEVDKKVRL